MKDIRLLAKKVLNKLENINSSDLDNLAKNSKHQVKMKKIISLSDKVIFSEDLKDVEILLRCQKDIINVFSFLLLNNKI